MNVSLTGDQCTLRAAIQEANDTQGADTICFNIPDNPDVAGLEVKTISPASALPTITEALTIDGYTQPGSSPNTSAQVNDAVLKVQLNGTNAGPETDGLKIVASESVLKGLVINRFGGDGVVMLGSEATDNRVEGNFIGTDAAGTADLGNAVDGVRIDGAPNNTIGGTTATARNIISGNGTTVGSSHNGSGIRIEGSATGNEVEGNLIGTDKNGSAALGNALDGVSIFGGSNNTVGGTQSGARNVISDNELDGVRIFGAGATDNKVQGNFIGTSADGTAALGNGLSGVLIHNAPNNTVGGTQSGARNVISGNEASGVSISGTSATDNRVEGNFIGTSADGTTALGNGSAGVRISGGSNNTVGGTQSGARNIISGNEASGNFVTDGVEIGGSATGNKVQGNFIGTSADGSTALGNDGDGVHIFSNNNIVGGTEPGARNLISGNGGNGVAIFDSFTSPSDAPSNKVAGNTIRNNGRAGVFLNSGPGNSILSNQIFANAGLGIDLFRMGVTNNDTDDPDTGSNNLQNFPVITTAARSNNLDRALISGTLNSRPNQSFTVQCFVADGDPSGHGEGQSLLTQDTNVRTDSSGDASFSCDSSVVRAGQKVSVTATSTATGDTSEFSRARTVVQVP